MADARRSYTWRILLGVCGVVTFLRMVFAASVQLAPDEAYYWIWSLDPRVGYRDHPPLLAWLMALVPDGLGAMSEVWVRLPALLAGAAMIPATYLLMRSCGCRRRVSLPATLALCMCPIASAGAVIVTPDGPLLLCWTLALAAALRFARGAGVAWLVAASAAASLALLSKLTGILLVPVLACAIHARKDALGDMKTALVLASVLPVAALCVIVIGEHAAGEGPLQFQLARFGSMALDPGGPPLLVAALAGLVGMMPAAGVVALVRGAGETREVVTRTLAWGFWPTMAIMICLSAVIHVEVNWPAVAIPSLAGGWAMVLQRQYRNSASRARLLGWSAVGIAVLLTVVVHLHAAAVLAPSMVGRGPASRLHGWRELARVISASDPGPFVTDEYGLWSEIRYYGRDRIEIGSIPRSVDTTSCSSKVRTWKVSDVDLGLERVVQGWSCPDGTILIRSAPQ